MVLVVVSAVGVAQPQFFEPKEGYYKAKGAKVEAVWALDRASVPEDGAVVATLMIRGATNPREVVRPELAKLAAFDAAFQVENLPGPPPAADLAFVYRLRPRNRGVTGVPPLNFYYLNPAIRTGNPFQLARARGVPIEVTAAAPKPRPPAVPLAAPERLLAVETGPRVLDGAPFAPSCVAWGALGVVVLLAPVGWYAGWRWAYPDAARLARRRRSRAERRALAALRSAPKADDPAGACAAAVLGYLRERFPLPPGADTPPEVADALATAGVASDDVVEFLRACDAARFGGGTAVSLPDAAGRLVARLEAAG